MTLTEARTAYLAAEAVFLEALTTVVVTGFPDPNAPSGTVFPPTTALMLAAPDSEAITYLWEGQSGWTFQLGEGSDFARSTAGQIQLTYNPGDPVNGGAGQTPDGTQTVILTVYDEETEVTAIKTFVVTVTDGQFVSVV